MVKYDWLPLVHFPLFSKTVPSGHTQATDRLGWESMTTQRWSNWQGLLTVQGFWQVCDMHASLDGQSWSILHSGSSAIIAKQEKNSFQTGSNLGNLRY